MLHPPAHHARKRSVIEGLTRFKHAGGVKILDMYVDDSQVKSDAIRAKETLSGNS